MRELGRNRALLASLTQTRGHERGIEVPPELWISEVRLEPPLPYGAGSQDRQPSGNPDKVPDDRLL